jgi:hypothetical protein
MKRAKIFTTCEVKRIIKLYKKSMLFICVAKLSNLFYKRRLLFSPDTSIVGALDLLRKQGKAT